GSDAGRGTGRALPKGDGTLPTGGPAANPPRGRAHSWQKTPVQTSPGLGGRRRVRPALVAGRTRSWANRSAEGAEDRGESRRTPCTTQEVLMRSSPNRLAATIFGAVYLLVGVLGFTVTSGVGFFATEGGLLL